jgi:hypothetical protein
VDTISIIIALLVLGLMVIAFAPLKLRIMFYRNEPDVSVLLFGTGPFYDQRRGRFGISVFGFRVTIPIRRKADGRPRATERAKKAFQGLPGRLNLSLILTCGRAFIRYAVRLASSVRGSISGLAVEPVFSNPALTGMAFGWTRAVYGVVPGLADTLAVTPSFTLERTAISGRIELSIRIWQMAFATGRFLLDLPIREIVKSRKAKRGG